MNSSIEAKLKVLLLACMEVTAEGQWNCFFEYYGHVNNIVVRATNADHAYHSAQLPIEPFKYHWIQLDQLKYTDNSDADRQIRILGALDAALAAVQGLRKQEVPHVA